MVVNGLGTFIVYHRHTLEILATYDSMMTALDARRGNPYALVAGRWAYEAMLRERVVGSK